MMRLAPVGNPVACYDLWFNGTGISNGGCESEDFLSDFCRAVSIALISLSKERFDGGAG